MSGSYRASTVERALHSLLRAGPDGEPPEEELAALRAARSETLPALAERLAASEPAELAATIRLVRLMGVPELTDDVVAVALRRPAPLEAKAEAIETLRELGVEVPGTVQETLALARSFVERPDPHSLERVLELPETWRMPVIEAWLGGGRVPDPDLVQRALSEDPSIAERVVTLLGGSGLPEAATLLRGIAERTDSKAMRKLARRGLHRLRSLGVEVADEPDDDEPAFSLAIDADPRRESRAWITGIDGEGGRIAWVLSPSPSGGDRLLEVVLDDTEGVRKAELMSVTRKGFRAHVDRLRANPGILVVQAELPQIAVRLLRAERCTTRDGGELPDEYRKWRQEVGDRLLEGAPQEGGPELPVLEAVDLDAIRADRDLLRASVDLLGEPYFANWSFSSPLAEAAARGVRRVETSDVVVDEEQRKEQVDRAIAGAAEAFDEELRARYRRRLEEMADTLWSSRHQDQARMCLAAAMGFTEVADLYAAHPFARALIQRGVLVSYQSLRQQEEEQERGESRIIRP